LRVFTSRRIAAQISESWALKGQFPSVAERANSPKNELFGAVACLKPGLMEFNDPLYQHF
jgi:hypothetical protein